MDQEPGILSWPNKIGTSGSSYSPHNKIQIYRDPLEGFWRQMLLLPDPELTKWSNDGGEGVKSSNLTGTLLYCLNYYVIVNIVAEKPC